MKKIFVATLIMNISVTAVFANQQQNYDGDPIDISARKHQQTGNFQDEELQFFEGELKDIKNLKVGFEKKGEVLDELNHEAQDLDVYHKQYAKKKLQYNSQIDKYKQRQACINKTGDVDKCFESETDTFIQTFNTQIARHKGIFEKCYQDSLITDSDEKTSGVVDFRFRFLPSGHIEHISIVDKLNRKDRKLVRCVHSKIGAIKFPKTGKSSKITIGKVFNFNIKTETI